MPSFLEVVAVGSVVIVGLMLLFVTQSITAPSLIAGTLSDPIPQTCNQGKQWVVYNCKPNALTRLGCIVPGSNGRFVTRKTIAVQNSSCSAQPGGAIPGDRVISFQWTASPAGPCITGEGTCCVYNGACTSAVTYTCVRTSSPEGGENQCTPQYLPVPYPTGIPPYNSGNIVPVTLQIPCRENYCGKPMQVS